MDHEEALKTVREVYFTYPKRYQLLQDDLRKLDDETQDLLHLMELKNVNASRGYALYKDLQRVRKERRMVKDEIETLEPIIKMISQAKPVEHYVNDTIGKVRKIRDSKSRRTYTMRVRKDLQDLL